jgi:hypothetical protein
MKPNIVPARRTRPEPPPSVERCRHKFLRFFPDGFQDETYYHWERGYKWRAHEQWMATLGPAEFRRLLRAREFAEIAAHAVRIESRTNLLFSFEKMALRDAVRSRAGAERFSRALFDLLHGRGDDTARFDRWVAALAELPRRQTRVLTWPLATVFGFIAEPERHFFLKPNVTKLAAREYGYPLPYQSKPTGEMYAAVLRFARQVDRDLRAVSARTADSKMRARDLIDIQSFLWVQGSDEYEE